MNPVSSHQKKYRKSNKSEIWKYYKIKFFLLLNFFTIKNHIEMSESSDSNTDRDYKKSTILKNHLLKNPRKITIRKVIVMMKLLCLEMDMLFQSLWMNYYKLKNRISHRRKKKEPDPENKKLVKHIEDIERFQRYKCNSIELKFKFETNKLIPELWKIVKEYIQPDLEISQIEGAELIGDGFIDKDIFEKLPNISNIRHFAENGK